MKSKIVLFYLFVFQIISFTSCIKEEKAENTSDTEPVSVPEPNSESKIFSSENKILSLKFEAAKNNGLSEDIIGVIDSADSTKMSFVLPYKKRELITKLVPTIEFVGEKIEPDPSTITDFSRSVAFTITPEKGEAKIYTVIGSVSEPSSENKILSLKFEAAKNNGLSEDIKGVINSEDSTKISVVLPVDKGSLIPTIEFVGEKIEPDPSTIRDFSNPVTFTITSEKGEEKTYTITVSILKQFISKWNVAGDKKIVLPIYEGGDYDFTVDWGDGSGPKQIKNNNISEALYTYTTASEKTITITGKIEGFNFGKVKVSKDKIVGISSWGDLKLENSIQKHQTSTSYSGCFEGCAKLKTLPQEAPNLEGVTNMQSMFNGATVFNGDIGNWNVSSVTNMSQMFYGARVFNGDISNWRPSNVTNMEWMFDGAAKFNQDLTNWDVSKVTNMQSMFNGATAFNGNISNWRPSEVTNMQSMFNGATAFNRDLSKWTVSNVTNMQSMFYRAKAFNQNIGSWTVSNVTDMRSMFDGAIVFNGNISNWRPTNVTDMRWMFDGATQFCQDLSSWQVQNITRMTDMFRNSPMSSSSSSCTNKGKCPTKIGGTSE
ncbi:BspA family leucine-rich repeat surface protein [Ichthyobacterium seriolicida]|uniref:PKD domain-containing protein n=1 Tax=Ichthyobacterium seriolicida TaxID=242600 RepID=A0A1J1E330_9FLAO|nr:BspA family leucine-rich repeat surface protein [Ichthyobacterium seriolicida]BAV95373.1 hypothetical protein JBKA6_1360 [Ichthyobacterium seriolicida]